MATQKPLPVSFPKSFLWGTATSAHQVEGNTHNQWSVWELENAKSLAHQAAYKLTDLENWPAIKDRATNPENYISGRATDHYHRYEKDFDIVKAMNMNSFRFSIEWSRVEPREGEWDKEQIEHYRKYIQALLDRGIEPMMTLMHWTLPTWFTDKGGFEKYKNIQYFVRFAEKVLQEYGSQVRYVCVLNEPEAYVFTGWMSAEWPPAKQAPLTAFETYRNLATAHRKVYKVARKTNRRIKIGTSINVAYHAPADGRWLSRLTTRLARYANYGFFLGRIRRSLDWLGVNYYFSHRYIGRKVADDPEIPVNDLGWEMRPGDLEMVLTRLAKKYKKPMIVTESGLADEADKHRKWWITHSILAIDRARKKGARVEGYLHWSLLDNFEWAKGKWPCFGLVSIDYKTLKRSPRPSAIWFARILKQLRGAAK